MATVKWIGGAQAVAQVTTVSFSAYTSGQTYTIEVNNKAVSFTATASSASNVIAGLVAALAAATDLELREFTATDGTTVVRLTGNTAGVPFTATASATTGTATVTTTTSATGPNHWDNADNFDAAPSAGDDIVIENSSYSILYGLVDTDNYASLTIAGSFVGTIGLPVNNASGYREYRPRYLKLGDGLSSITVSIGQGAGSQSSRINLDFNAGTIAARVFNSGQSVGTEKAIQLIGMDSSSTIEIHGGSVEIGGSGSAASSLTIAANQLVAAPSVSVASGVTITTLLASGACAVELKGTATTLTATLGATVTATGTAASTTITVGSGARVNWSTTDSITTLTVQAKGAIDFSGEATAKTFTNATIYSGSEIYDPNGVVTWTNGIILAGCRIADVKLDLGAGITVTA